MSTENPATVDASKKRKVKELPPGLEKLTESSQFWKNLKFQLETDGKEPEEVMVAYEAFFEDSPSIPLDKLTLDQLRTLCKNVGCHYVNKCNKFHCRKALWILAHHHQQRERDGVPMSSNTDRNSNNIIRITNVIFSHAFIDGLLALNDNKTRADHESGRSLPNDFWANVAETVNILEEDDSTALQVVMSEDNPYYNEVVDLDLEDFDLMTPAVIKKKFNQLMKVRRQVQVNMTTSGEHDSDAFNFIDVAMKKVQSKGLTKIGCYYFFVRCEDNPEIDVRFNNRMEISLMGSTDASVSELSVVGTNGSGKKRAHVEALEEISSVVCVIAEEMKATNRLAEKSTAVSEEANRLAEKSANAMEAGNELKKQKNELAKQTQLIQLAQHLGKNDFLEKYFADLAASGN